MDDDMIGATLIDPTEYEDLPKNEAEWRRRVWFRLGNIERQTMKTNGRVSRVEKVLLGAGALIVGFLAAYGLNLPRIPGL